MTTGGRAKGPVIRGILIGFVLPAVLLVIWWGLLYFGLAAPRLLPPPGKVVAALVELTLSGDLALHLRATLARVAGGFAGGAVVAILLGALTGCHAGARRLLDPTLQGLRAVPSIAWVPLFVLWLGIGEPPKLVLIALGAFFPVYLNLAAGLSGVDRKLVEVGRVFGLSGLALVRRILLPAALPALVVGLRGGLGLAWMFAVAAELMGASEGIGFLLLDGQMTGRPAVVIAAILLFALFGKLSDALLAFAGRRLLAWQDVASPAARRSSARAPSTPSEAGHAALARRIEAV